MANELNIIFETGLTLTGKVYNKAGTQQGSNVAMSEVATSQYSGAFDLSTLADGVYLVHFYDGTSLIGSGDLDVKDGLEVSLVGIQTDIATKPTIAQMDNLGVNIQQVNGYDVKGEGTESNPWNPI